MFFSCDEKGDSKKILNLDHVASVLFHREKTDAAVVYSASFYDVAGDLLGEKTSFSHQFHEETESHITATVIAAQPGYCIVDSWLDDKGEIVVSRTPIVAFRFSQYSGLSGEPITADGFSVMSDGVWAIETPIGTLFKPEDRNFENFDEFKQHAMEELAQKTIHGAV